MDLKEEKLLLETHIYNFYQTKEEWHVKRIHLILLRNQGDQKVLKFLAPSYFDLKKVHYKMSFCSEKRLLADIISAVAPVMGDPLVEANMDCLIYCLYGTIQNPGVWGYDYIHELYAQVVRFVKKQWESDEHLERLIILILQYYFDNNCVIQACDLLMEIDRLKDLEEYINYETYDRICLYLTSCARYVEEAEQTKIYRFVARQYAHYSEWIRIFILAMHTRNKELFLEVFTQCYNPPRLLQLAFLASRQMRYVELPDCTHNRNELVKIINNGYLSSLFLSMCRKMNIMDAKTPDFIINFKSKQVLIPSMLGCLPSDRKTLASALLNGFVNAGFSCDSFLTGPEGLSRIYELSNEVVLSVTASLGLVYLWNAPCGYEEIIQYLYSPNEYIKSGAILAYGILNCRTRGIGDSCMDMLTHCYEPEYPIIQNTAILALGLAYMGTNKPDVTVYLTEIIVTNTDVETFAVTSLALGLINVGNCNSNVSSEIITRLAKCRKLNLLNSPHVTLAVLGMGLLYLNRRNAVEKICNEAITFPKPFFLVFKTILHMCAYIGSGDITLTQQMLRTVRSYTTKPETNRINLSGSILIDSDYNLLKSISVLALGCVSLGEDSGKEMCTRLIGSMGRNNDITIKRAVPLSIALCSISKPDPVVTEVLLKYAEDPNCDVATNAIFGLGLVGAGTNNTRIGDGLRSLASYHNGNEHQLFMVRIAQGLIYLGKGTMTLNPIYCDMQLMDYCGVAGLLIPLVAMLEPRTLILKNHPHFLYTLAAAIMPRWLLTVDENLQLQAVDVQIGTDLTSATSHTTPALLGPDERVQTFSKEFIPYTSILEGVCIVKKQNHY